MEIGRENITLQSGDAYLDAWTIDDIDFRTAVFKAQIREKRSGAIAAEFVITDLETRTETRTRFSMFIPSAVTVTLTPGKEYVYDIQYTQSGEPYAFVSGAVTVERGVTS